MLPLSLSRPLSANSCQSPCQLPTRAAGIGGGPASIDASVRGSKRLRQDEAWMAGVRARAGQAQAVRLAPATRRLLIKQPPRPACTVVSPYAGQYGRATRVRPGVGGAPPDAASHSVGASKLRGDGS